MAKLIGHLFTSDTKQFTTFEVDGLKETPKQFTKTAESEKFIPKQEYRFWSIMPKKQLGQIKEDYGFLNEKSFTMYDTADNTPLFKKLVVNVLRERAAAAKTKYENISAMLESAESALLGE